MGRKRGGRSGSESGPETADAAGALRLFARDAASAYAGVLRVVESEVVRLPRRLRAFGEDAVSEVVHALLADDARRLRAYDPQARLGAIAYGWLKRKTANLQRGEARELARRSAAGRRAAAESAATAVPATEARPSRTTLTRRVLEAAGVAGSAALRSLTPTQRRVLRLLRRGFGRQRAATALGITPDTVRDHCRATLKKLGTPARADGNVRPARADEAPQYAAAPASATA
jgi:DNA-binding CsgD family transcriptional regulator